MDFNTFYKNIRQTEEYDTLMDLRYSYPEFKQLTSKGFMAVLYINDLFDQKYKVSQIIKLFKGQGTDYIQTIRDIFECRLKDARKSGRKKILWDKADIYIRTVENYNKKFVNDEDYFNQFYPVRVLK